MPEVPSTQAQKFEREKGRAIIQPPPPFPNLPDVFVNRYPPEIKEALRGYDAAVREWVRKYIQGQS